MHLDLQSDKAEQIQWDAEQDALEAHYETFPLECSVVLPPACYALLIRQTAATGLSVGEAAALQIENGIMNPVQLKKAAQKIGE